MASPVPTSHVHPSSRHCHCCTTPWGTQHPWTHSQAPVFSIPQHRRGNSYPKRCRTSQFSTTSGFPTCSHGLPTSTGLPQGPTVPAAQPAQCILPNASVAARPCQIIQGYTTPRSLSPSFPHRLLQLVVSCATSHAGPGGRQLPELSSPSSALAHGTNMMWSCMTQTVAAPRRRERCETEEDWKRKEPSHGLWVTFELD